MVLYLLLVVLAALSPYACIAAGRWLCDVGARWQAKHNQPK